MEISSTQRERIVRYFKLKNVTKISKWDELNEGEKYHVPPLIVTERFDFTLLEKGANKMKIIKDGSSHPETIYKTDILTNFIVKDKLYESNNAKKTLC